MKNVLIPTDFTTESLQLLNQTAETMQGTKFNAVLFHAFNLPDDIIELMFIGRDKIHTGLVTDEFRNRCRKIKNLHHETLHSVSVKYIYGNTVRLFKNFADANHISLIVLPEELQLQMLHKYSVHPASFLKKSGIEIMSSFETRASSVTVLERKRTASVSYTQL